MCPAVQPERTTREDTQEVALPSHVHPRQTVRGQSCCDMYLSIHAEQKSTSSVMLLNWSGGIRGGREGPQGPPKPAPPPAVTAPSGPSRGRQVTANQKRHTSRTWPPAKRHLTRSCPVSGQCRLPAAWMQPGRTLGFFAVERGGENHSFSLSHRPERETGRNDRRRGP